MNQPTVLITGASSGIGEALARQYGKERANLVLCARRLDRLKILAEELSQIGAHALVIECDVTRPEDLDRAAQAALAEFGELNIVVANAGFGVDGYFENLKFEDYERQFKTNIWGVFHTIKATLPALKQAKGRLVILGSFFSYVSAPGISAYTMSKFAIKALADSLYYELGPAGVSVTLVCPGSIASEIRQVSRFGVRNPAVRERLPTWLVMPAETAAKKISRAVARRKREVVITSHAKLAVFLQRHCPKLVELFIKLSRRWLDSLH